jgi:integrase
VNTLALAHRDTVREFQRHPIGTFQRITTQPAQNPAKDGTGEVCGFHAFRRFRITHLRKQRVTEVLLRIWVGHSTEGITDKYTVETLKRDVAYRKDPAEQAGLGFHTPLEHQLPVARIAPRMYTPEFVASA